MKTRFVNVCTAMVFTIVLMALVWPSTGHPATTITAQKANGSLDPADGVWGKKTPEYKITLDTVITATGVPQRLPSSKFKTLKVKTVHDGTDIWFRLEWTDKTMDTSVGDPPLFADAVALEIPYDANSSIAMGNQFQPVNILFWRADMGDPVNGLGHPQNIVSGGAGTVQKSPDSDTLPTAFFQRYVNGTWTVIIRRAMTGPPLDTGGLAPGNMVNLVPGSNYRITFAQWDGGNQERDAVKLVAGSWQTLYISTK